MDEAGRVWRGFWTWWTSELLALLPTSVRGWLGVGLRGGWLLRGEDGWQIQREPQADADVVGAIDLDFGSSDKAALALARTGIYIALDRDMVLEREIELPLAAQENLREVVGFELDRHSPFRRDQAWFDYRVLGRDAIAGRLRLRLFLAPKHLLDKLMQGLRDARLPIRGILPLQAAREGDLQLNLLPAEMRDRPSRLPHLINLGLLVVLVAVLAMAALLPLQRQQAALAELQPQLQAAKLAAEETRRLRDALEQAGAAARFMPQRLQARTDLLLILEEITRLLPDDTWLRQVDFNEAEVRLFGESGAAAELITLLETSPMFTDVGFRSPVTQDPRSGSERFQLGMRLASNAEVGQ